MINTERLRLAQAMEGYIQSEVERNHMRRVSEHCAFFAELLETDESIKLDRDILIKAALVHDIAKKEYGEDLHREKRYVRKVLRKTCRNVLRDEEIERISRIVHWHAGKKFCPKRDAFECALLRMADKVDKYEKERDKLLKKQKKYIKSVKAIAEEMENDELKRKKAVKKLRKDMPKKVCPAQIARQSCAKNLGIIEGSGALDDKTFVALRSFVEKRLSYIGLL